VKCCEVSQAQVICECDRDLLSAKELRNVLVGDWTGELTCQVQSQMRETLMKAEGRQGVARCHGGC
jgi:hypothetical protein